MAEDIQSPYIVMTVRGEEDPYPLLLDVTSFLYDFNLLYEWSRLGTDHKYEGLTYSPQYSWGRNNRPLDAADRLRVARLSHESPLLLVTIVAAVPAAVGAIWGMTQIIEKISNWPLNREILKLQRDKLRQELSERHQEPISNVTEEGFRFLLRKREVEYFVDRTMRRLEQSPVRVKDIELTITEVTNRQDH